MLTKFERDKVYDRRDGRKMTVICTTRPCSRCIVAMDENGSTWFYRADGTNGGTDPHMDLMLPKPEPIVEWGYWIENGLAPNERVFRPYTSEQGARDFCATHPFRLAKRVTTFEG